MIPCPAIGAIIVIVVGSSTLVGFNLGATLVFQKEFKEWILQLNNEKLGSHSVTQIYIKLNLFTTIFYVGAILAAVFIILLGEKYGRKQLIIANSLLNFIAIPFLFLAGPYRTPAFSIVGSFVLGLNSGVSSQLAPLYLVEIAPRHLRSVFGMTHGCGSWLAYLLVLLAYRLTKITPGSWAFAFAPILILTVLQLIGIQFLPESPRFFMLKGRPEAEIRELVSSLYQKEEVIEEIIYDIKLERDFISKESKGKALFKENYFRRAIILSCLLAFVKEAVGLQALFFFFGYVRLVAKQDADQLWFVLVEGFGNTMGFFGQAFAFFSVVKMGAKGLLLISNLGLLISSLVSLIFLFTMTSEMGLTIFGFLQSYFLVFFFNVGYAAVPQFAKYELTSPSNSIFLASVTCLVTWVSCTAAYVFHYTLRDLAGASIFAAHIFILLGAQLYLWIHYPKTQDKTIPEIIGELKEFSF